MIVPVFIDTSSLVDFLPSESSVRELTDYTVKEMTARFAREWEKTAGQRLNSTRDIYLQNIIVVDDGFAKGSVVLNGVLPNMIEQGADPFDLKKGLLNGPKAKVSAKGDRYTTVPFRFSTPGAIGENQVFSARLPSEIHSILRDRPANIPVRGGGSKTSPIKESDLPRGMAVATIRKAPPKSSFGDYQRKSSIYKGAARFQDNVTGQSRYQSFRRVSENSEKDSWIHKGFEAYNIAEEALNNFDVPSQTSAIIDQFLRQV